MMALLSLGWNLHAQDDRGYTTLDIVNRSTDKSFRGYFDSYLGPATLASDASPEGRLLQAIKEGDLAMTKTLLEKGADPLQADSEGCAPLIVAVKKGSTPVIDQLLRLKSEEQLLLKEASGGNTALHLAVLMDRQDIVQKLLEYSPNLEDRQCEGKTALLLAVEKQQEGIVQTLLGHSPSPRLFTQSNAGNTPLHRAVTLGHEILRLLLRGKDAARSLKHKNQCGETPMWLAVRHGNLESFRILRGSGASLRVTNNDDDNLWHLIAQHNNFDFLRETVYLLHPSDLQGRNRWNDTPLTIAERNGYAEIAGLIRRCSLGSNLVKRHKDPMLNVASPRSLKLFYTLTDDAKWTKEDSGGYWTHLTYDSYQIYERIYMAAGGREKQSLPCR